MTITMILRKSAIRRGSGRFTILMLTTLTGTIIIHQVSDLTGISALVAGVEAFIPACTPHFIMVDGIVPGTIMVMVDFMAEVIILTEAITVGAITPEVTGEWDFTVAVIGPVATVEASEISVTVIMEGKTIQAVVAPVPSGMVEAEAQHLAELHQDRWVQQ